MGNTAQRIEALEYQISVLEELLQTELVALQEQIRNKRVQDTIKNVYGPAYIKAQKQAIMEIERVLKECQH